MKHRHPLVFEPPTTDSDADVVTTRPPRLTTRALHYIHAVEREMVAAYREDLWGALLKWYTWRQEFQARIWILEWSLLVPEGSISNWKVHKLYTYRVRTVKRDHAICKFNYSVSSHHHSIQNASLPFPDYWQLHWPTGHDRRRKRRCHVKNHLKHQNTRV